MKMKSKLKLLIKLMNSRTTYLLFATYWWGSLYFLTSFMLATPARADLTLHGAGATFPYPLYSRWFAEYHQKNPQVKINYGPIGSGGGIQHLLMGAVDFAASDVPLQEKEKKKSHFPILQIPTVLGAICIIYNLDSPSPHKELRLSGELLVKIFLGQIRRWNDPLIMAQNPHFPLPDKEILVIRRSDGSGSTAIFTEYLSTISELWKRHVGKGKSVKWPLGLGIKGNDGVAGLIKRTKGSIGFVELSYAHQNHLPIAALKNRFGHYVRPTLENLVVSAQIFDHPDPLNGHHLPSPQEFYSQFFSFFNGPLHTLGNLGERAYPLTTLTYLLIPLRPVKLKEGDESNLKRKALKEFLFWALSEEAQEWAGPLHYAPLPLSFRQKMHKAIQDFYK